jgi:hypothetical protein
MWPIGICGISEKSNHNIFAEALKSSIFVGSIENFFRTTPLKKVNNKLVPFKDDGTLIVSGSSNSYGNESSPKNF